MVLRGSGMGWAREEFQDLELELELELGDARRTQRLIWLVDALLAQPTASIPLPQDHDGREALRGCRKTEYF